ncbi:MAG: hypothetical protein M1828_002840 [Chrysothrix sp. TS-e1954]|nr:MAG: hypothetical protein M1828_002840 [Chrysothrix sp. TS-e1954]
MARLNEPATESLETLKRRFMRQNKDLARSNSLQSLKIRSLECEIAALLSENASLHQTIINLSTELEDSRTRSPMSQEIEKMYRLLDGKAREFGSLIEILGELGKKGAKRDARRKSQMIEQGRGAVAARRSPEQRNWRNERSLGEVLQHQEGKLPTINEDKTFPRRTLDPSEMSRLLSDANSDSPDIGPPPRTSLFDSSEQREATLEPGGGAFEGLLSANFETRRRRRETRVRADVDEGSNTAGSTEAEANIEETRTASGQIVSAIVRTGAKRKLDWRSQEKTAETKPENLNSYSQTSKRDDVSLTSTDRAPETATDVSPAQRKVLGPKPVNTDPVVSPRKPLPATKEKPPAKPAVRSSTSTRNNDSTISKPRALALPLPNPDTIIATTEIPPDDPIKREPKTPYGLDVFSPPSTKPSAETHNESRDTPPPPSDIGSTRSNTASNSESSRPGRGSLRTRAAVSYTEPSLVSKMRRPSKDMAPAVVNGGRNSVSAQPEEQPLGQGENTRPSGSTNSNIKGEEEMTRLPDWSRPASPALKGQSRPEPGSPLSQKEEASRTTKPTTTTTTTTQRRRSVLQNHRVPPPKRPDQERKEESADIFEVDVTSPSKSTPRDATAITTRPKSAISLAPSSSSTAHLDHSKPPRPTSASSRSHAESGTTASKTGSLRRRQTLAGGSGVAPEASKTSSSVLGSKNASERAERSRLVHRASSSLALTGASGGTGRESERDVGGAADKAGPSKTAAERGERIAARRRSMML